MKKTKLVKKVYHRKLVKPEEEAEVSCHLNEVLLGRDISIYSIGYAIGIHPNQIYHYASGNVMPSIKNATDCQ